MGGGGIILQLLRPAMCLMVAFLWWNSLIGLIALGENLDSSHLLGEHWGYLTDVRSERTSRVLELVLIDSPIEEEMHLNSMIFVPGLKKEFLERYEKQFGRTVPEQSMNISQRYDNLDFFAGPKVTAEEYNARERVYGEYVLRRLVEYHVDVYAKESPSLRPVYEVKERVSNVRLEVKRGYRVKIHYSFSGNYFDLSLENPWEVESQLVMQMNENSFGPGKVRETTLHLSYPLSSTVRVASFYGFSAGQFSLAGYKQLQHQLATSITGSAYLEDPNQERKLIVGLAWNY